MNEEMDNQSLTQKNYVYVGSYADPGSAGIHVYTFNTESGVLTYEDSVSGLGNPSFLAVDARRFHLFAVSEVMEFQGTSGGAVASYAIQPETGKLTFRNVQPTFGGASCHISMDREGKRLFTANYMGGSVSMFPIADTGEVEKAAEVIQHYGSSILPGRQEAPHAHSVTLDPTGTYAFAADLGLDKIIIYKIEGSLGKMLPHNEVSMNPGAGPRHLVFHPGGNYVYVINELDSTITAFTYDSQRGTIDPIQTVSTQPEHDQKISTCADIHISPCGKFLYGSNRGHDSIAVFAIDTATGKLTLVEHASTLGKTPRNFALSPDGRFVLVANQDSNAIVVFERDEQTGQLQATGHSVEVSKPVCIRMVIF
jgi:6-phosphogluconolactonase